MQPLIQDIIIDLTESQNVVAYANQYDNNSRIIRCHIQNKGEDFSVESHILNLRCKKSNNNGIYKLIGKDGFGSISGNIIEIPIIKEMTISSGRQVCDIEIYDGERLLYTCTFYLRVAPGALSNEAIKDSDDYEDIHQLYEQERDRAIQVESNLNAIKVDKTTVATSSTLGLVKSGTDIAIDENGNVSVNDNSHNHTVSNISDLTATAEELNVLDGIAASTTELNYIDGVTSNIQNQLNNKSDSDHLHDDRYYTETEIDAKLNTKLDTTLKGTTNGIAELDANGLVPSSQLPSYVDDVIEGYLNNDNFFADSEYTTEIAGEAGKIYIDLLTNKTYRWSGSVFVVISETLALGETSSTAYRGDWGKIAYDHSQSAHAPSDAKANQNAFSNVVVDASTVAAQSETDTLSLVSGNNITITPDMTNNEITITSSHPAIIQDTDSASEAAPLAGETFTAVDSVTRDENGHVTKINTKTVTLPSTSIIIDDALSSTSTNPVQNNIIANALDGKLSTTGGTVSGSLDVTQNLSGSQITSSYNTTGQIKINPTTCTESSIYHMTNNILYWAVGHGCGGVGQGYYCWWYNPSGRNLMTLRNDGYLNTDIIGANNRIFTGYDCGQAGAVSCSNWFRSSGATGWYNETYGGGIYMPNSEYVAVYNGKNFLCNGTILTGGLSVTGQTTLYGAVVAGASLSVNGRVTAGSIQSLDPNVSSSSANCRFTTGSETGILRQASSSSRRYKHDITKNLSAELDPEKLYDLNIYQYKYNADYLASDDIRYMKDVIGFIAEDVYEKYSIAADYYIDENGELIVEDWVDRFIIPPMLALLQNQHQQLEEQKLTVSNQSCLIQELTARIEKLESQILDN